MRGIIIDPQTTHSQGTCGGRNVLSSRRLIREPMNRESHMKKASVAANKSGLSVTSDALFQIFSFAYVSPELRKVQRLPQEGSAKAKVCIKFARSQLIAPD